jgi:tripartite-type tricarboxylate transporter receptor subunit TctC
LLFDSVVYPREASMSTKAKIAREASTRLFAVFVILVVMLLPPMKSWADDYPSRPVKVVVPLLSTSLTTYALNPSLYKTLPYDPAKDFVPVSLTGRFAFLLVANPKFPANSLDQLIAMAKSAPDTITFASAGPGSPHQMAMELLLNRAGVKMVHVPYKGASPALKDLISGEVPVMMLDVATAREPIKAGLLKVLASAAPERSAEFPIVPTIAEAGFPGYEASAWQGIVAPAKTPHEIIEKLNGQIGAALADPAVKQRLQAAGIEPIQSTPESFAAYMQSETLKWQGVIKAANISLN